MFQSTRAGDNDSVGWWCTAALGFNPRPRAGDNKEGNFLIVRPKCFNPRPRAGDNTRGHCLRGSEYGFQSTPARGRQRERIREVRARLPVSIHARARATTESFQLRDAVIIVSIHARARATTWQRKAGRHPQSFNPRPRAGDNVARHAHSTYTRVSIHARARATTDAVALHVNSGCEFQSTPARGRQPKPFRSCQTPLPFQSTPARGRQPL